MITYNELDEVRGFSADGMITNEYEFRFKKYKNKSQDFIDQCNDDLVP